MSKLKVVISNGHMNLEILALIGDNALLHRLNDDSFVVANGLNIHSDFTCEWNFAYGYFQQYKNAYKCFNEKVLQPFLQCESSVG